MIFAPSGDDGGRRAAPLKTSPGGPIKSRITGRIAPESNAKENDMNVTRYEPWRLINLLQRDLDQIAGRRFGVGQESDDSNSVADWIPPVDIVEEKDRFVLRADLPGVNPDQIDISMENGILSIAGERREEKTERVEGMQRVERISGKFYRRFSLPETADADNVSAKSSNGILEVEIPKQAQVQARRIAVQAS
jgi:HSP20 family protein